MKQQRPLNTYVGAIVGAIPPMIGWAACSPLAPGAWVLGGVLAVWQIPHFMALSWSLKDDYARGGFKMLVNVNPEEVCARILSLTHSLTLSLSAYSQLVLGCAGATSCFGILAATVVVRCAGASHRLDNLDVCIGLHDSQWHLHVRCMAVLSQPDTRRRTQSVPLFVAGSSGIDDLDERAQEATTPRHRVVNRRALAIKHAAQHAEWMRASCKQQTRVSEVHFMMAKYFSYFPFFLLFLLLIHHPTHSPSSSCVRACVCATNH
jgi:hypothetical protein